MENEEEQMKDNEKEIKNKYFDEIQQIEEWTETTYDSLLFDSNCCDWKLNSSTFDKHVINKEKITLMIEDTNGNIFGVFIDEELNEIEENIVDKKSFVYSLKSNGRFDKPMKFNIEKYNEGPYLYNEKSEWLISIGSDGGNGGLDDITIMKQDCQNKKPGNGCVQQSYNYGDNKNALCGSEHFDVKRFFVFQMK